jgi:hypothetical protein
MTVCRPAPIPYRTGTEVGFTLMSDLHIGAPHVDYRLIKQELAKAIDKGDRILINGDVIDAILPKDHKRFDPDALHPRLQGRRDVLNEEIAWAVELLAPAAHLIDMIGVGNHEDAVAQWHALDPLSAIIGLLNQKLRERKKHCDHVIHYGGWTGFVDYRFRRLNLNGEPRCPGGPEKGRSKPRQRGASDGVRWVVWFHHGSGGAAPVTKGTIDFARKAAFITADLLWMGHKHNRIMDDVQRISCPQSGDDLVIRDVRHVMTGAYMQTYVGQSQESIQRHGCKTNYAAKKGLGAQGMGGARVVLTFGAHADYQVEVTQ